MNEKEYQQSYHSVINYIDSDCHTLEWLNRKFNPTAVKDCIDKKMLKFCGKNHLGIDLYKLSDFGKANRK